MREADGVLSGPSSSQLLNLQYELAKANQEASFFFSFLMFVFTFFVCMSLQGFRNKPFLPSKVGFFYSFNSHYNSHYKILVGIFENNNNNIKQKVREIVSNFAVLIAIVIASFIDHYMHLNTEKLLIPSVFQVKRKCTRKRIN